MRIMAHQLFHLEILLSRLRCGLVGHGYRHVSPHQSVARNASDRLARWTLYLCASETIYPCSSDIGSAIQELA